MYFAFRVSPLLPFLCLLATLLCTCAPATSDPLPPPNVLFILTDDQGIGDLSLHGNDSIRTPNLDRLLTESAQFDHFYVSPVCAPTRASFLTGRYHPRTGAVFVTRRRETMAADERTLAEYLRAAGYRTGLFGKWHNGATKPHDPAGQGFDEFLGFSLGHFNDYFAGELENEANKAVPFRGDLTDILTDTTAAFALADDPAPFFAMLAYQAPHTPVQVADDHWDAVADRGLTDYNTGIYAMIESIDEQVGRLRTRLEAAGRWDNTIVVFATDNGPNGDRFRMGLKGTKGQVDEGSVRVPFGIKLPAGHPANGRRFDVPAAHIDLLPTLLDYLGLPVTTKLDGRSLLPLLNDEPAPQLTGRWVYTFKQGYDFTGYPGSVRNDRFLLVLPDSARYELYDLRNDPGQKNPFTGFSELPDSLAAPVDVAGLLEDYKAMVRAVAPPEERIAPPIDLDAAAGVVHLLAHEGEPRGDTRFNDAFGWANDWFVNLGGFGAFWPVDSRGDHDYTVTVEYQNETDEARTLWLGTGDAKTVSISLPPARARRLPVADRTPRKEVYPHSWPTVELVAFRVPAGSRFVEVFSSGAEGISVKSVRLTKRE